MVERAERLLDRRLGVEAVELVEIDVVRPEPPEAGVDGVEQMIPRRAEPVRVPAAKRALRRDDDLVPPALDRRAKNFFRVTAGVYVRGIEHGQAGLETDIDESRRLGDPAAAPSLEELVGPSERTRAEAQHRHLESRVTQFSVFHGRNV